MAPELGKTQFKYFISDPNKDFTDRTIDAKKEKTRRIFKKVAQTMETRRSQIVAEKNNFSVTNKRKLVLERSLAHPDKKQR